jgi:hypothetical protein
VDHSAYRTLRPAEVRRGMRSHVAIDTRGTLDRDAWELAGFKLVTLGRG